MASEINVDKITPQTGTTLELGDSGDTITVTGTLDGSGLTGLNANNLASGTVPEAKLLALSPVSPLPSSVPVTVIVSPLSPNSKVVPV